MLSTEQTLARRRWSLASAYAITVVVIIASGVIALLNARTQEQTAHAVMRANQVLARLTEIETSMADAETAERGYLLTGDDSFLEPYHAATGSGPVAYIRRPSIDKLLADTHALPPATPAEAEMLQRVETLAHAKLDDMAATIELRRFGHLDEAVSTMREDRGKRIMDALRIALTNLRAEERRQLNASEQKHQKAARQALWSNTLACCLALITLAVLFATSRRAQNALVRQHEAFEMLADNISQHAWTLSPEGKFQWFNRRWYQYTGLDRASDLGEQWRTANSHPSHHERVEAGLRHAVETGSPWEDIFPLRAADGSFQWFLVRALPILDAEGKVRHWFGTDTNIDKRLRLEQELKEGNRRKDEFIATLAHELRNPLAPIQAGLELMKLNPAFPPPLVRTRDIMSRQLAHLVRLIDDLLDVSRISSGKLDLQLAAVPLRDVIESALETSRPHIEASGHRLDVSLPAEPLLVNGDLVRLAQVVGNLLNNGAKYTPDGGAVGISAQREDKEAVIRVSDNGIGIDREMLPHIFDLFSQAPTARDRRKGGIGVGLSIARQLVQMHGGSLSAESPGIGYGSTFTIRLPLVDWDGGAGPQEDMATPLADVKRVLILDDNEDAALTLGTLLEMAGHTVALAHTGREAIELATRMSPDIAFLDIGLPDMSGYDVARALRANPALDNLRLVALTGWGAPRDREQGREAGFEHHLTKPVTLGAIGAILPDLALPERQDRV
ncbi:hypothetical protein GCM10027321_01900 [Massilia terrae]|uniref:histidine kinase n=1 Tax=Massilia terrae TaxID=1811224 RepID=A0ABT2CTZ9_9BURK|nr:ATP-binding protein [Massilia terrae]MCS0657448.1 CHASE3 domain-containing protein [Massilia terrae]